MGILYGHETEDGYEPSWLHHCLKPEVSGNKINGLGETEKRNATPVYHRRSHKHPWYWVQESFYCRQMWDMVQGLIIFKSWLLDRLGHCPVAKWKIEDSSANWSEKAKEFAMQHPECDIVGIARVTPEMIFDHDYKLGLIKHPWIIVIGRGMDYDKLSNNLKKDDGKWRPFWKNKFLPEVREVLDTYLRSQTAAWKLADWIRKQGYDAVGHGGPKGGPIITLAAAHAAGLGELGKHGSLIHNELGSCMRFSFVLTDMPLVSDKPIDIGVDDFCMNCRACYKACPPKAISNEKHLVRGTEKWYVNFDKCVPYFNENYGCAICLSICPWSRPGVAPKLTQKMLKKRAEVAL